MTATAEEADLGLNLVFESAPKPTNAYVAPAKKRGKNKYDRRREKGRLAKLSKHEHYSFGEPEKAPSNTISLAGAAESVEAVAIASTEHSDGKPKQSSDHRRPKAEGTIVNDVLSNDRASSSFEIDETNQSSDANSNTTQSPVVNESVTIPHTPVQSTQPISSRKNRAQSNTVSQEEERARYLSEFHARPRELDRNEKASREIKASIASAHIFESSNIDMKLNNSDDAKGQVSGDETNCPFRRLGLHANIVRAITNPDGYFKLSQPTIVQTRAITVLLPNKSSTMKEMSANDNLFIQSETGSGKTLAYLLPILQHLAIDFKTKTHKRVDRQIGGTRAILLMPTRELSTQTYNMANHLCSKSFPWIVAGCLSGGEKRKSEKARLRKGITMLIATPGRLLDHLSKTESLMVALKGKLEWFVLDEVDRLLDAGLAGQVEQIVQYLRSNQPRAGVKKDGVTWRSVLVSATVTSAIEGLAKTTMGGEGWKWARGHNEKVKPRDESSVQLDEKLLNSAPRQLAQQYMVVSAKLRLCSLIGFLAARASKGERSVVFMSTCDGVDYHHALFTSMSSIFANEDSEDGGGVFGKSCPCYKLHGNVPQAQRIDIINQFSGKRSFKHQSAILLCTDVAARGLNLGSLDWIVQYDPPCETNDYIHRAGRSARAGASGHSLLFLLPSERQYIEVLQLRGMKEITALSLSATLASASELCASLSQEGGTRPGKFISDGKGEAFTLALQNRLEQCVIQDDADYKASIEKKVKDAKQRRKLKKNAAGPLLVGARKAFFAFVRAYPAKEKAVKHIFNARGLHLGHIARSLALRETPKMVSIGNIEATKLDCDSNKQKSRLTFSAISKEEIDEDTRILTIVEREDHGERRAKKQKKEVVVDGKNTQKKMMEQAMRLQDQGMEFM